MHLLYEFSSFSFAQSDITSRRVQSEGNQILVNQIETGDFPKVSIFVTVLKDGIPVKGLAENDFTVTEDEVEQEPLTVVPKLSSLSTVMTLDVSGSMRKRMDEAKIAAKEFVNTLKPEDKVQAMTFARKVKKLSELSTQHGKIKEAIDGTVARGDTALYDAIYESVATLKGVEGRKAIIVLSDGVDDDGTGEQLSKRSIAEALELAQEINVPIYTIGLGTKLDEATLRNVVNSTGGLYFNAPEASQLKELYAQIGQQLSGQYNIYYNSNLPGDASLHKVKIASEGLSAYKAYKSPLLEANNRTLEASNRVSKIIKNPAIKGNKKSYSLPKLATFKVPDLVDHYIRIYKAGTNDEVDVYHNGTKEVQLLGGSFDLKFRGVLMETINLPGGQEYVFENKLGMIYAPELKDRYVRIYKDGTDDEVAVFHTGTKRMQLPLGRYDLLYRGVKLDTIHVTGGSKYTLQGKLGTIKAPNLTEGYFRIYKAGTDDEIAVYHSGTKMMQLPVGKYDLSYKGQKIPGVLVEPNDLTVIE